MLTSLSDTPSGYFHCLRVTIRKLLYLSPNLQTLHLLVVQLSLFWLAIRSRDDSHAYVHKFLGVFQLSQVFDELGAYILL